MFYFKNLEYYFVNDKTITFLLAVGKTVPLDYA